MFYNVVLVLYNNIYIYICLLSLRSAPVGRHTVLGWAPCITQQLPTGCFTHDDVCMSVLLSQFILPPFKVIIDRHALISVLLTIFWLFLYFSVIFFSWSVPL